MLNSRVSAKWGPGSIQLGKFTSEREDKNMTLLPKTEFYQNSHYSTVEIYSQRLRTGASSSLASSRALWLP